MMKSIKIEGYIWAYKLVMSYNFIFINGDNTSTALRGQGYIPIAPYTIEIDFPEDLDMYSLGLTALQEKRKLILADNQVKLNQIAQEIQEYLAVEHKP